MAHNTRLRAPGDAWASIALAEIQTFDQNLANAINGDGGTYSPLAPLVIGGLGIIVSGPLVIHSGGVLQTGPGAQIICGVSDYPELDPLNPFNVHPVCFDFSDARGIPAYVWRNRPEDGGFQAYSSQFNDSLGGPIQTPIGWARIRAHDTATITSVTIGFRVPTVHTSIPTSFPKARVLRQDQVGNVVALTSQAAGADIDGYVAVAKPQTPRAWDNAGQPQSVTFACDQNNVVDVSSYSYWLEVVEEQGLTGAPFSLVYKLGCSRRYITQAALFGLDGNADGDRVLLQAQADATQNGIWIVHPGFWVRAPDLSHDADFTPGMVVPVYDGSQLANFDTYWQVVQGTWTAGNAPPGTRTWIPSLASPAVGTTISPTPGHYTGLWYVATTVTGNGGATEPSWPTILGQTVVDGSITWTAQGQLPTPLSFVSKPDVDNPTPGSGFIPSGVIWQGFTVTFANIADLRWQ